MVKSLGTTAARWQMKRTPFTTYFAAMKLSMRKMHNFMVIIHKRVTVFLFGTSRGRTNRHSCWVVRGPGLCSTHESTATWFKLSAISDRLLASVTIRYEIIPRVQSYHVVTERTTGRTVPPRTSGIHGPGRLPAERRAPLFGDARYP